MKTIDLLPQPRPDWFTAPELVLPSPWSGGNIITYTKTWRASDSISRGAEFRLTRVPE